MFFDVPSPESLTDAVEGFVDASNLSCSGSEISGLAFAENDVIDTSGTDLRAKLSGFWGTMEAASPAIRSRHAGGSSWVLLRMSAIPALKKSHSSKCTTRATKRAMRALPCAPRFSGNCCQRNSGHAKVDRSKYWGDRYSDNGRYAFGRHRAAAFSDLAADSVCSDCVDHGAGGIVRVDDVLSESAHARGWYTHGTGSGAARRVAAHPEKCLGAVGLGAVPGTRVYMDRNAAAQVISIWRGPA